MPAIDPLTKTFDHETHEKKKLKALAYPAPCIVFHPIPSTPDHGPPAQKHYRGRLSTFDLLFTLGVAQIDLSVNVSACVSLRVSTGSINTRVKSRKMRKGESGVTGRKSKDQDTVGNEQTGE